MTVEVSLALGAVTAAAESLGYWQAVYENPEERAAASREAAKAKAALADARQGVIDAALAPLIAEREEARVKAIDSLARYKFAMFGYWAGIWVHLNRLVGDKQPNPFKHLVLAARADPQVVEAASEYSAKRRDGVK